MSPISIEQGRWFYFTVDLDFHGFAEFEFERFLQAGDREGALVNFVEPKFFPVTKLILLPYTPGSGYFKSSEEEILSVWTFDGSAVGNAESVDLKSGWPNNILDKAAITPSLATAQKWTGAHNAL